MHTQKSFTFSFERETKNKYRFREEGVDPVVGTLYVSKALFESRPSTLEVELRSVD